MKEIVRKKTEIKWQCQSDIGNPGSPKGNVSEWQLPVTCTSHASELGCRQPSSGPVLDKILLAKSVNPRDCENVKGYIRTKLETTSRLTVVAKLQYYCCYYSCARHHGYLYVKSKHEGAASAPCSFSWCSAAPWKSVHQVRYRLGYYSPNMQAAHQPASQA